MKTTRARIPRYAAPSALASGLLSVVGVIGLSLAAPPAHAGSILHVGPGVSSPCATGGATSGQCQYLYGSEVNGITPTEADIYVNSNDPHIALSTLYVILGVPDSASFSSVNAIASATTYEAPGGSAEADLTASYVTSATMGPGQEAYSQFGYTGTDSSKGTNSSNNFPNWSGADLAVNGINATGFNLYEYQLSLDACAQSSTCNGIDLEGQELVDLTFANALPLGTYLIGYGTQAADNGKSTVFDTPFTEAGLVNAASVPEPGTLTLFGAGFAALGFGLSRRRKSA